MPRSFLIRKRDSGAERRADRPGDAAPADVDAPADVAPAAARLPLLPLNQLYLDILSSFCDKRPHSPTCSVWTNSSDDVSASSPPPWQLAAKHGSPQPGIGESDVVDVARSGNILRHWSLDKYM